jgi:adenosine deaminase
MNSILLQGEGGLMIDPHLPLIDLHRHLDGSVRLETILDLSRKYDLPLPAWDLEGLRPYVQVTSAQPGVMAFIEKLGWMTGVLVDYEACRRIAYESVEDAYLEGIHYVELRFSPWFMSVPHQLDPANVVKAVGEGVKQAVLATGMRVNLIGILSRSYGPQVAWQELEALLQHRDSLVAVDLAGDEENFPAELFVEHFKKARQAGLLVTAHAGEVDGPDSIWRSIQELGAARIGHAVRALEDPDLVSYMAEHRIGIEANLTSNLQTSTVEDYASHPMRQFIELGLLATINSDDPGVSGITLRHEYEIAAPAAGLSQEQIRQAQKNAWEVAFLSPLEKQALLDSMD